MPAQHRPVDVLDAEGVLGKRIIVPRLHGNVTIRERMSSLRSVT